MSDNNVANAISNIFNPEESSWSPSEKIPLLTKELEQLKNELKLFLCSDNYDIVSILEASKELCSESKNLLDEMMSCKDEIEQGTMADILKSIADHDLLSKELQVVMFGIQIVFDIQQCAQNLKEYKAGLEDKDYTRMVDAVIDNLQLFDDPTEGFDCLDIYYKLRHVAEQNMEELLGNLYEVWDRHVMWCVKPDICKTDITITLKMSDSDDTFILLESLEKCKKLALKVNQLSQFLLKEVLVPMIHNECTVIPESDEQFTVTITHKQDFKPHYETVIANLKLVFHFLSKKLNVKTSSGVSVMSLMGAAISRKFRDIIMEDCFKDTIPSNINDLACYSNITSIIQDFQHYLVIVHFFPEKGLSVLKYMDDIDSLYAEKSSQYFLETARNIMFKDLSDTMPIGVENIPEEMAGTNEVLDENDEKAIDVLNRTIPKSLFFFPRCLISKSAQELLDLVRVMMEQAPLCQDIVCKKLYSTARMVFAMYDSVVPYHHENYLQKIPQYVALFHNNCMYLAHNLMTLGDEWLFVLESREIDYPITFLDLVPKLRELGYKHLTMHMQQQRKQILDNIRASDLNCIVVKDVLGDNAEAAIRQCLRQLQLLRNVWLGVFPANVFTRLMATLVNMFIDELIHRVCTVEDISMEMATQLKDMYTLVIQKVPQLFKDQSDVDQYIKPWTKLKELIFVLGGSLKDIEARWDDGDGPLAQHFRTEELRNLIKALFQNTQFRANLLSKIK